jgi:hypothetical protein
MGALGAAEQYNWGVLQDAFSLGLVTTDSPHHEIHDGDLYSFTEEVAGLAQNSTVVYYFVTAGSFSHLIWIVNGDITFRIQFYEAPTVSANGSAQNIYNVNRGSTNTPKTSLYKGPTVSVNGTLLSQQRRGSGTGGGNAGSGDTRDQLEWVLAKNQSYLFIVTALAATALNYDIQFRWYEI